VDYTRDTALDEYENLMQPLFERLGVTQSDPANMTHAFHSHTVLPIAQEPSNSGAESQVAHLHQSAMRSLEADLLAHIYAQTPSFFECLIIDLLLAMGYGTRRRDLSKRIGQSHDGGVDGLISQDELGLEVILVQAKRLKPNTNVSVSQVRDFVGALESRKATKGVFVTTGTFTIPARMLVQDISRRIVLINGAQLAALMVRHNLGVKVSESYVFKNLDLRYFQSDRRSDLNPSKGKSLSN
jgi:restriction system protein